MDESSYWVLRCGNQFFVVDGGQSGKTFPLGAAADFCDPATALRFGDWQRVIAGKPSTEAPAASPADFRKHSC